MVTDRSGGARVAILLSTYNGERFLAEQLASLAAQTYQDWVLFWRDDGSTDGTSEVLREFSASLGPGRSVRVEEGSRIGHTPSFLRVLNAATAESFDAFAFADQDDVWLPDKLARGTNALGTIPVDTPALYCARQVFVDDALVRIGLSCRLKRAPGFPAALTQNVATGCTLMLNRSAARLVSGSQPPPGSYHDWWSYLLVAAAGGRVLADEKPTVLYRQHAGNLVGAPPSVPRRALAALRRGPGVFMNVFRQQVVALAEQPHLLSDGSREQVQAVAASLRGGMLDRMRVLRRTRGLYRQTWAETLLFRAWFLIG
ncbi:MAG: glycosyltransferase family 2 protein [Alphaproteobacteria bacterium]|nr:glycosyltransferase family 2 protein [Alphaproteobacteria bacterium]